jgi:hypothetical protein
LPGAEKKKKGAANRLRPSFFAGCLFLLSIFGPSSNGRPASLRCNFIAFSQDQIPQSKYRKSCTPRHPRRPQSRIQVGRDNLAAFVADD